MNQDGDPALLIIVPAPHLSRILDLYLRVGSFGSQSVSVSIREMLDG